MNVRPATAFTPSTSKKVVLTDSPMSRSGPDAVRSVAESPEMAAIERKALFCSLQSAKFRGDTRLWTCPGDRSHSIASSPGLANGSGRNNTLSTRLKIALLAPMPIARTATTTAANPGVRRRVRRANRKS
jgi:hypothetical protein